jgi:hypothetical protein
MKKSVVAAFAAVACFAALPALADEAQELSIASTHAGLAGKAAAIDGVHMHLHHALNCLVGPAGTGFDASNANPCAKAGNGAIPDAMDAGQKTKLQAAVAKAQEGIAATDLMAAQKAATETADAIGAAKM